MLSAVLRVVSDRQQGTRIPLPVGRFLIGREEDCHLRPNSDLVSRHHCVFTNDDYTVRVRDLGSTNGTFVNGQRLRGAVVLKSGDRISVGKLEFEVLIGADADPASAAAAPQNGKQPALPAADETGTIVASETATEVPAYTPPLAAAAPANMGDTAMFPAMPQYPQAPYQAPYGQAYPYPAYPPMYPGYYMPPAMPYPAPGYAPQIAGPTPVPAPKSPLDSDVPDVRLPDPATTGAKAPEPAAPKAAGAAPGNVPDTAAVIIKQYLQRRPSTTS